ncbi:TonB-dependent receptor [Chitinilyticum piscinae]|uniref:TonB-dependent receptor n=1 Tax=Chitinilyticum piscinae TaxID=2866724 RepID=A0A8J7FKK1_9NEIS|nr:TonB-dependent receptor [Chitinilyticum piscinae]MBE9610983.1 TonB-dependent receptor [Chitinilyticum piscinae]
MNSSYSRIYLIVAAAFAPVAAFAAPTQLDEVVVTAARVPTQAEQLPVSTTVITASDIAASPATSIAELLSAEVGIRSFNNSGSQYSAPIDLRGFGVTASSNTLILVDGVRQNTNDLAAPNLAGLPLSAIERIEIVRGSGAVAYGGGTTGGVINIITRKAKANSISGEGSLLAGSDRYREVNGSIRAAGELFALDAFVQSLRTDHYRDNNAERVDAGGAGVSLNHDTGSVRAFVRISDQNLRLPGGRTVDPATGLDEMHDDPRGTSTPDNFMDTDSHTLGISVNQDIGANGVLLADAARRDKDTRALYRSGWGDWWDERELEETTASVRYEHRFAAGHQLIGGMDLLDSRMDGRSGATPQPSVRAEQRHHGIFAQGLFQVQPQTTLTLGARRQWIDEEIRDLGGGGGNHQTDTALNAWEAGLRHALTKEWSAYARIGKSFRLPNADELAYLTEALRPQTSLDKEVGIQWQIATASARLAVYRYDLEDEIHFNKLAGGGWGSNVNLDPTRRQGIELEGSWQLNEQWRVLGNTSWQDATFRSGSAGGIDLAGNRVPMTPEWLANAGVRWMPMPALGIGAEVQYVGKQRLDNDQSNQFAAQLAAYTLFNVKLDYRFNPTLSASLVVNNLFDQDYASYGIRSGASGAAGSYVLYPEAGRTIQASLSAQF